MRPLPFITIALAALTAVAGHAPPGALGQGRVEEKCPTVTVTCADLIMSGAPTVLTANVGGGDEKVMPSFAWEVSAGTITSGRNESSIVVDTTGLGFEGRSVTATVKVGGYPPECRAAASCTTEVYVIRDSFPLDDYGNIRFADEKARLDNYAIELKAGPELDGYIICYGGRRGRRGEAQARCARARNYLVTRRQIPAERVITVDGGYRDSLTVTLWPMPRGVEPTPSPTVDPSEVEFVGGPQNRRSPARRPRTGPRRNL